MGVGLAFALCPCVLGSCVSSCVACLACWVLGFVLVLRGRVSYGFILGLAFAAVNWVYSIECMRVCCQ